MKPGITHPLLTVLLATTCAGNAALVISDDFDDGSLSPAWTVTTSFNATAVSASESGSAYQVVSLAGPSDEWASHQLDRHFPALGDFHVTVDLSWNSTANGASDMFRIGFALLDGNGDAVARMFLNDAWVQHTGGHVAIGGDPALIYSPGYGTAALAGSPTLEVVRSGGTMDFLWDGTTVLESVADDRNVESLTLYVEAFSYTGFGGTATFSPLSFGAVSLEGSVAAVPEPSSAALCAIFLCISTLLRRKPRAN